MNDINSIHGNSANNVLDLANDVRDLSDLVTPQKGR